MNNRELLTGYLKSIVNPTEEELNAFFENVTFHTYPKRKRLIQMHSHCTKIYFVIEGYLKYVIRPTTKEMVVHISGQADLVTDFASYFFQKPASTSVYTITDCELACAEKRDLEKLYDKYKVWERFGRLVAEQAAVKQIYEKIRLQTKTAEEIYVSLISKNPEILQHVKLGDLAQSLGISQETLSRIRSRIIKKK